MSVKENTSSKILVLDDQGGGIMTVYYDRTGTLRSQTKHHEPIVLIYDARGNGGGEYAQPSPAIIRTASQTIRQL